MRSYLVIFHVNEDNPDELMDVSNDPCFDTVPTWGICRPNVREYISEGDYLFYIGYYKSTKKYYIKGYFKVGEKIAYNIALERYPNRKNVIVSRKAIVREKFEWRYKDLWKQYKTKYNEIICDWLLKIESAEGVFYQSHTDYHEIDNWKCRRIFHCNSSQFRRCIQGNSCEKKGVSLSDFSNYIVSDNMDWCDIGYLKIQFADLAIISGFLKKIETPRHQHNALRCDDYKDSFIDFINRKRKSEQ